MRREEYEAEIVAFIRNNGITRCPTACAVRTQGVIAPADRVALESHAAARSRARQRKIAVSERAFAGRKFPAGRSE